MGRLYIATGAAAAPFLLGATPAEVALTTLLSGGAGATINPALTYAFSGGQATPQQLANASAQGLVYGSMLGYELPGVSSALETIAPNAAKSALGRAATGALTNIGYTNAYNLLANGQPAPLSSDIFAGALGAGIGAASPYIGNLARNVYASALGRSIYTEMPLEDYATNEQFNQNPSYSVYMNKLKGVIDAVNYFGGDPSKIMVFADSNGNLLMTDAFGHITTDVNTGAPTVLYNDVHLGYAFPQQIQDYLNKVSASTGEPLKLATTSPANLPNELTVESQHPSYNANPEEPGTAADTGEILRGVRRYAYGPTEGMYFNVPSMQNSPIQLNYNPLLGETGAESSSSAPVRLSLNPFAARGTFLQTEVNPEDIFISSKADFARATGINPETPEGKVLFSKWLADTAQAQGYKYYYPYQNYYPNTNEVQVMAGTGQNINAINTEMPLIRTQPGMFGNNLFLKLATASSNGEAIPVETTITPNEQASLAEEYNRLLASSSTPTTYYSPYGNVLSGVLSSIYPSFINSNISSFPSVVSLYPSATSSVNLSPSVSLSLYPSTSPAISVIASPSATPSPSSSLSLSLSTSPSASVNSYVSPTSSISFSTSQSPSASYSQSSSSSLISASPSQSSSFSSSLSPSSSSSYSYLYSPIRKYEPLPYLRIPYWYSYPQPTVSQVALLPSQPLYSPSLLPVILPELEPIAEASYSPLTALTTMRPLKAPSGAAPLLPQPFTGSMPVETTITNPEGVPNPMQPATQPETIAAISPQLSQTAFN
ncbi:MAG: hypothetical protein QW207_04110, partial [Candidatus Micrarchaeaceae archaeon]